MSDKQTAIGTLAGITEKPTGWTRIEVSLPGKQYPLKMDTKIQEFIELARAAGTNVMEWSYSESDSGTPNPNKPGQNYVNRRLEGVAPVSENRIPDTYITPQTASPSQPATSQGVHLPAAAMKPDVDWDSKERRDYRSRAWAQTLAAFQHTIKVDEKPEDVFNRLQPFQRKVFTDVCQSFAYPHTDEDENIPFS